MKTVTTHNNKQCYYLILGILIHGWRETDPSPSKKEPLKEYHGIECPTLTIIQPLEDTGRKMAQSFVYNVWRKWRRPTLQKNFRKNYINNENMKGKRRKNYKLNFSCLVYKIKINPLAIFTDIIIYHSQRSLLFIFVISVFIKPSKELTRLMPLFLEKKIYKEV